MRISIMNSNTNVSNAPEKFSPSIPFRQKMPACLIDAFSTFDEDGKLIVPWDLVPVEKKASLGHLKDVSGDDFGIILHQVMSMLRSVLYRE